MASGEAEVSGESAAAGVEHIGVDAGAAHERSVGLGVEDGVLVAVPLHDRLARHRGRLPARAMVGEEFGKGDGLALQARDVVIAGQEFGSVGAEDGGAAGFQADDEATDPDVSGECRHCSEQDPFGGGQLAGADPGQPAAESARGQQDPPPASSSRPIAACPTAGLR